MSIAIMASQIRLFQFVQGYQRQMGIYSIGLNQSAPSNYKNLFFLCCFGYFSIPAFIFFVTKANSFKDYAESSYGLLTGTASFSFYVVQMFQITNFDTLITKYEEFIEQNVSTRMPYYVKLKNIIELFTVILNIFSYLTVIGVVSPQFLLSYISYFIFDLGCESFYLPFPSVLAFDWKTPFGYLIAALAQSIQVFCSIFNISPLLNFMFGSCLLFIAFVEDITKELEDLSSNESSSENDMELKKRFCHIIQLYSEVKQFIDQFNEIYEFVIFIFLAWCLITISCDLLLLQTEFSHITDPDAKIMDVISAIQTISMMSWSFILLTFFCGFGELVTNQFNQFHEELCQSDWYSYSLGMQRLYLTFMGNTQEPAVISGYANVLCTRDTFRKTINTGFSYFMMARRMK